MLNDTDVNFEELRKTLDEVYVSVMAPAIVGQATETNVPGTTLIERSRLADWLFSRLNKVNITAVFSKQTQDKLLSDLHESLYISEPMYAAVFAFYMRMGKKKKAIVNLLDLAYSSTVVGTANHTHDLIARDITTEELERDGMYLFIILVIALGYNEEHITIAYEKFISINPEYEVV